MALMDSITANYTIDTKRIVVTGFSAGGRGTWFYAASYPDFFTAAVPVAGEPLPAAINTLGDMPVYVIHGVNDEVILYEDVAPIIMQMQDAGLNIKFVAVNGLSHYNTSGYIGPLNGAVPWIREQWNN
jgi:predicted peptidase